MRAMREVVVIRPVLTKTLALAMGLKSYQLIHHLMSLGEFFTMEQLVPDATAYKVAALIDVALTIQDQGEDGGTAPPLPAPRPIHPVPLRGSQARKAVEDPPIQRR